MFVTDDEKGWTLDSIRCVSDQEVRQGSFQSRTFHTRRDERDQVNPISEEYWFWYGMVSPRPLLHLFLRYFYRMIKLTPKKKKFNL